MADNQAQLPSSTSGSTAFVFNNNALVQTYTGLFSRIHAGFRFVTRSVTGKIVVYDDSFPIVGRQPFTEAKFINISRLSRTITYPDGVQISDDVTVTCSAPITYHFYVIDKPWALARVFKEVNADQNISELVKKIVDAVVNNMDPNKVRHKFTISYFNLNSLISDQNVVNSIKDMFHDIRNRYGIHIDDIMDIDFNEPQTIIDAKHASKVQAIENQRNIDKATTDLQVAGLNAQAALILKQADYRALQFGMEILGWTPEEMTEYIKADLLKNNPNVSISVFRGFGGLDGAAAMVLNSFYKKYNNPSGSVDQEQDDIIDVNFQDASDQASSTQGLPYGGRSM